MNKENSKSSVSLVVYLLSLLAVALLSGGGMYVWLKQSVRLSSVEENKLVQDNSTQLTEQITIKPSVKVNETDSWKKFKYEGVVNFEMKYPQQWQKEQKSLHWLIPEQTGPWVMNIDIYANETGQKDMKKYAKQNSDFYTILKNFETESIKGVIVSDATTMGSASYLAFFPVGNYIVSVNISAGPPKLNRNPVVLLEKILSTFRKIEAVSDSRILLTPENIEKYNKPYEKACDVKFNNDKATDTVVYVDKSRGLSVELPYNPNWGNETYRINPYDEYTDDTYIRLRFGPVITFEGCSWSRLKNFGFVPVQTVKQTEVSLRKNPTIHSGDIEKIQLTNGLTAFQYIDDGIALMYTIEVVGKKHNYVISWPGTGNAQSEFAHLRTIAESIKLID
ncbi:hypothetical protein DRH14_00365 [Candidatus Shapirobacteria bacterium]|nr:MAG: hypothetical protein DRH14_00365 [Candidatus Shapirobacteria bacterium]